MGTAVLLESSSVLPPPSSYATGINEGAIVKRAVGERDGKVDGFLTVITVGTTDGAADVIVLLA